MRTAKDKMEQGDYTTACTLYDQVIARFPTWWMSLAGRVRCGLERDDPPELLVPMLTMAERYEAPPETIGKLRSRLLRNSGKIEKLCELLLPAAIRGEKVVLPLKELLVFTWLKGRYGDTVRLAERMRKEGQANAAVLRLGAEAAILSKDARATDLLVPKFLDHYPERFLMVRYIRDLRRRGRIEDANLWTQKWRDLVVLTLPDNYSAP